MSRDKVPRKADVNQPEEKVYSGRGSEHGRMFPEEFRGQAGTRTLTTRISQRSLRLNVFIVRYWREMVLHQPIKTVSTKAKEAVSIDHHYQENL